MLTMVLISLESLPTKAWAIRYTGGMIPVPAYETLQYLSGMDILSAPGLALHIVTSTLVMDTLINAIERANKSKLNAFQLLFLFMYCEQV